MKIMSDSQKKPEQFNALLQKFLSLPKTNSNPTFMEICQMSGDRFEERCSQILRFFLTPNAAHGFRDLFLSSLLKIVARNDLSFSHNGTKVITEEMTEDHKFIDITVVADDFVIAIENKINASLYNPLDSYVSHIKKTYRTQTNHIFVLLSARPITDVAEISKIKRHGYHYVNYRTLFDVIKKNLGTYALDADQSYLTFLFDFIRTIENRYSTNNMELKRFFYDNRRQINWLKAEYEKFENQILQLRKERIGELLLLIKAHTGADWWAWQGWDLGVEFNKDGNRLGIEASFKQGSFDNPLGVFGIYVTVWNRKHYEPYREALSESFSGCLLDEHPINAPSRIYLHIPVVEDNDTDKILDKLTEVYNKVKAITEKIK